MNDEIKEILEHLKNEYWRNFPEDGIPYKVLYAEEVDSLLEYITNLQQENEELKKNQRYYKNGVFSLEYDKETLSDMVDDYKSRVEKAVEYINNNPFINSIAKVSILNILQNGSDSE